MFGNRVKETQTIKRTIWNGTQNICHEISENRVHTCSLRPKVRGLLRGVTGAPREAKPARLIMGRVTVWLRRPGATQGLRRPLRISSDAATEPSRPSRRHHLLCCPGHTHTHTHSKSACLPPLSPLPLLYDTYVFCTHTPPLLPPRCSCPTHLNSSFFLISSSSSQLISLISFTHVISLIFLTHSPSSRVFLLLLPPSSPFPHLLPNIPSFISITHFPLSSPFFTTDASHLCPLSHLPSSSPFLHLISHHLPHSSTFFLSHNLISHLLL